MVGELYINRKHIHLAILLVILLTSLTLPVLAERPSWAQEGVWLRYEAEFRGSYGGYTITAHVRYKSTLVEVTDEYGRFQGEIESIDVQINPPNEQLKSQIEQNMRNGFQRSATIYWNDCGKDYCPPNQLPEDGVVQRADGRYVYDTGTGVLREYSGTQQGATITLRLIDSSIGGGFGGIGGGDVWWVIIVVVIVVIVVIVGVVVIVKLKGRGPQQPVAMPPPPPPPPPQ